MLIGWEIMGGAVAAAAAVVAAVPRRWLGWAMLLWAVIPALAYFGVLAFVRVAWPTVQYPAGLWLEGFGLLSSVIAVPWFLVCLIGFPAGLVIRRLRWPARPGEAVTHPALRAAGPPTAPWRGAADAGAASGRADALMDPFRHRPLHPLAAWRTALAILAGAAVAIAAGAVLFQPASYPGTVTITPMPVIPQLDAPATGSRAR